MILWSLQEVLIITLVAFITEILIGYPKGLFAKISHPIVWLGNTIKLIERKVNKLGRTNRFSAVLGFLSTLAIVSFAGSLGYLAQFVATYSNLALLLTAGLASSLFATRSLWEHVNDIHRALVDSPNNLDPARSALAKIVSRETKMLNNSEVSSSAIESLSENTSDAVIAPLFWCLALGLPGLFIYKTINTLDSMWGYRNSRYELFGKFAAKFDDAVNWIPARLTALIFNLVSRSSANLTTVTTEASRHTSPNAGWPEAAMAYALNIKLGGEFDYSGAKKSHPAFNSEGNLPSTHDISRALRLYTILIATCLALITTLGIFALIY